MLEISYLIASLGVAFCCAWLWSVFVRLIVIQMTKAKTRLFNLRADQMESKK